MDARKLASDLYSAAKNARSVKRLTAVYPEFGLVDGYRVQTELASLHAQKNDPIVGRKMGLTSRAKMQQMGVHSPIHGFLTQSMQLTDGAELALAGRIHPKVEPEIAFLLGKELKGRPSLAEALAAVEAVVVALEVIDSRFENFEFQLPDVVADNCSSSAFVLGSKRVRANFLDLGNLGMLLEAGGRPEQFGSSAAILGHPGRALVDLVKLLDEEGKLLPPGSVVLAGAATAAIPLAAGQWVRASAQDLGSVEMRVLR